MIYTPFDVLLLVQWTHLQWPAQHGTHAHYEARLATTSLPDDNHRHLRLRGGARHFWNANGEGNFRRVGGSLDQWYTPCTICLLGVLQCSQSVVPDGPRYPCSSRSTPSFWPRGSSINIIISIRFSRGSVIALCLECTRAEGYSFKMAVYLDSHALVGIHVEVITSSEGRTNIYSAYIVALCEF